MRTLLNPSLLLAILAMSVVPRASAEIVHRSGLGPVLESSCLPASPSLRDDLIREFDGLIRAAQENVSNCQTRYPEISPYIAEWQTSFRKIQIGCFRPEDRPNVAGVHYSGDRVLLNHAYFSVYWGFPYIGLNRDLVEVLVHEIFHAASGVDNYTTSVHNGLHQVQPELALLEAEGRGTIESGGVCRPTDYTDRVTFLGSLCGAARNRYIHSMHEITALRVDSCGVTHGCTNLFRELLPEQRSGRDDLGARLVVHQTLLPESAAMQVCSRIYGEGACIRSRREAWRLKIARGNDFPELRRAISRDLGALLPQRSNQLRTRALRIVPTLEREFLNLRHRSECMEGVFQQAGQDYLIGGASRGRALPDSAVGASALKLDQEAYDWMKEAQHSLLDTGASVFLSNHLVALALDSARACPRSDQRALREWLKKWVTEMRWVQSWVPMQAVLALQSRSLELPNESFLILPHYARALPSVRMSQLREALTAYRFSIDAVARECTEEAAIAEGAARFLRHASSVSSSRR